MSNLTHLFKVGQKVRYICSDFDGKTNSPCTVTEVNADYMLLHDDKLDLTLWIEQGFNLECVHTI